MQVLKEKTTSGTWHIKSKNSSPQPVFSPRQSSLLPRSDPHRAQVGNKKSRSKRVKIKTFSPVIPCSSLTIPRGGRGSCDRAVLAMPIHPPCFFCGPKPETLPRDFPMFLLWIRSQVWRGYRPSLSVAMWCRVLKKQKYIAVVNQPLVEATMWLVSKTIAKLIKRKLEGNRQILRCWCWGVAVSKL